MRISMKHIATVALMLNLGVVEAFGNLFRRVDYMNIKSLVLGLAVAASLASTAKANLVMNGSLEQSGYAPGTTQSISNPGVPANDPGKITNWTVSGSGSTSAFWNAVYIYDNYLLNPLTPPAPMPTSYRSCAPSLGFQSADAMCLNPDGPGYFINLDGDPGFPTTISQTINGLMANQQYRLTFSWAAVERNDASGPTSDEYLIASLGNEVFTTANYFPGPVGFPTCPTCLPSKGFSGWFTSSYDFVWDGSSNNVLKFLAHGNPAGIPPTINLDGISLTAVPEPPIWALLIAAGFGIVVVARRRKAAVAD
jgi:hypothetical protein